MHLSAPAWVYVCGCMWVYVGVCGCMYVGVCKCMWVNVGVCGCVCGCMYVLQQIQTDLVAPENEAVKMPTRQPHDADCIAAWVKLVSQAMRGGCRHECGGFMRSERTLSGARVYAIPRVCTRRHASVGNLDIVGWNAKLGKRPVINAAPTIGPGKVR